MLRTELNWPTTSGETAPRWSACQAANSKAIVEPLQALRRPDGLLDDTVEARFR
jgi:hypothetical protein